MASRPIDEKIVAMKMDNSDLKQKATETVGLFGKLEMALNKIPGVNLGKTSKEINDISNAANRTDMSGLSKAVDLVASRFSTLGVVATTALANITNKVVDTGLQMMHSLSTEPIMDGFREYETKMGSIQTILANTQSKGTTLKDVMASLNELNTYADKTIYSFSDMTSNIGLFTNAGLGLKESTAMIKGFSNAAAASGSNAENAARAAYQLSQGLSQGYIMAMDWMSLTNAGMGNDNMKRDLIAIAQAMGTLKDGTKTTEATLKDWKGSLTDGKWLTSDVMSAYLQAMTGDMSDAQLAAIGLTKAQVALLQQNAKTGNEAATYVRTFTQMMGTIKESIGSGWATTFELMFGDFDQATKRWTALTNAIGGFFNKQSNARNTFVKSLADNGVFDTMFAGLTNVAKIISAVYGVISDAFGKIFSPMNVTAVFDIARGFRDFASNLVPSKETLQKIGTIAEAVFSTIKTVAIVAFRLGKALFDMIPPGLGPAILDVLSKFANLVISFNIAVQSGENLHKSASGLNGIFAFLGGVVGAIVKMFTKLGDAVRYVGDYLGGLNVSLAPIADAFKRFFNAIGNGYNWIKEKLIAFGKAFKKYMPNGNQILAGGFVAGLAAIAWKTFKTFQDILAVFTGWGKIGEAVTGFLESVSGALNAFSAQVKAQALLTIAIAVGVLAGAFLLLSRLNAEQIATGLYMIIGSLSAVIGAMAIMNKYNIDGGGMKTAITVMGLAIAVAILGSAIKKMSDLKWDEIGRGLVTLAGIMGIMAGAITLISRFGKFKLAASALQMLALAGAVYIMMGAIEKIAKIDTEVLKKGLMGLGVMLLELGLFFALASTTKFGMGSALGVLAVAKAIVTITGAIKEIGQLKTEELKVGMETLAKILTYISLFALLTSGNRLLKSGVALLLIAGALTAMLIPLSILGHMDIETLIKGLGSIGVILAMIAGAAYFSAGMITLGAALAMVAAGMTLLLIPISILGAMKWDAIIQALLVMGITLGGLAYGAMLLAPAIPFLTAFGVGIMSVAGGMALAGVGMALFGAGLLMLASLTSGAVATIVAVIGTLLVGLASLIPTAVDFIVKLVMQLADALVKYAPPLVAKLAELIVKLMDCLGIWVPKLIDKAVELIVKLVDGMATAIENNGQPLIDAIMRLIGEITILIVGALAALIKAFLGMIPGVNKATDKMAKEATKVLRDQFKAADVGKEKGKEFADGIDSKTPDAKKSGSNLGSSAFDGAKLANFGSMGAGKGADFATGIQSKMGIANASGANLASSAKTGVESVKMDSSGYNFGTGFAQGINNAWDKVAEAANNMAKGAAGKVKAYLDIRSPSRLMRETGGYFGEGFALGIDDKTKQVGNSAKNMATTAQDSLNEFIDNFELPDGDNELQFQAVINYDKIDPSKLGNIPSLAISPDTSTTNGLVTDTRRIQYQNATQGISNPNTSSTSGDQSTTKQPAVIQIVSPEKREMARWLVDDITDFQSFNAARKTIFNGG